MSDISQWSTSAASNTAAPPDGAPESHAASATNDIQREVMASVRRDWGDRRGALVTAGTGTAYTVTSDATHAALADIGLLVLRIHTANTGAATLAVDGLVAKSLRIRGAALAANDLLANVLVAVNYNATADAFDVHDPLPNNNASNLTTGTLPDARLSAQVLLKDGAISSVDNLDAADPGYRGLPQNSQGVNYTAVLADADKHLYATALLTFTIPANASVAYPIGTFLTFVNVHTAAISIAITTDTMTLAATTTTGTRTLARNGIATAVKVTATTWLISGTGLS